MLVYFDIDRSIEHDLSSYIFVSVFYFETGILNQLPVYSL